MTIETATDNEGFLSTDKPVEEPGSAAPAPQPEPQFDAPQKRKRGRPSNAEKMAAQGIPIGTAAPKASKPKAAKQSYTQIDYVAMGKQLVGLHTVAAMATGVGDFQITHEEGTALAVAIGNVAEQYDLAIDGKTGAALQLLMTAAMIYGPKALALRARAMQAKTAKTPATFDASNGQPAPT